MQMENVEGCFTEDFGTSPLKFSGFMGTTLFLLSFLGSIVAVANQKGDALRWAYDNMRSVTLIFPMEWTLDLRGVVLNIRREQVRKRDVFAIIDELRMTEGKGVKLPVVAEDDTGSIDFAFLFDFLLRFMNFTAYSLQAAEQVLHSCGRLLDEASTTRLIDAPGPTKLLPENDRISRLAAKGEDKAVLLFNIMLGKRQGSRIETEAELRTVSHWRNFAWARWAGTLSLVATALTQTKANFLEAIRAWPRECLGVRLSIDDSRVASQEVSISHIFAAGLLGTPPVQIKPDQAAALAPDSAFDSYRGVVHGGAGGRRRPYNAKKQTPTLANFYAVANVLISDLPITSLSPFLPSTSACPGITTQHVFDEFEQAAFTWETVTHESVWYLPVDLVARGRAAFGFWSWRWMRAQLGSGCYSGSLRCATHAASSGGIPHTG